MSRKTYEVDFLGKEMIVVSPRVELYQVRDFMGKKLPGLAIVLDAEYEGEYEQYGLLTVSFGEFIGLKNSAYIDTNNCIFAENLLRQMGAENTGFTKQSGFCTYPLWKFDEQFLKEIGGERYMTYSKAFDDYMGDGEGYNALTLEEDSGGLEMC